MAPKEGNSIVKHGVLDERLNVHGVAGLKVADLSICPDNVGCNTCVSPHTPAVTSLLSSSSSSSCTDRPQVLHRAIDRGEVCRARRRGPRVLGRGLGHEGSNVQRPRGAGNPLPPLKLERAMTASQTCWILVRSLSRRPDPSRKQKKTRLTNFLGTPPARDRTWRLLKMKRNKKNWTRLEQICV